jgi:hypothetical protein
MRKPEAISLLDLVRMSDLLNARAEIEGAGVSWTFHARISQPMDKSFGECGLFLRRQSSLLNLGTLSQSNRGAAAFDESTNPHYAVTREITHNDGMAASILEIGSNQRQGPSGDTAIACTPLYSMVYSLHPIRRSTHSSV